MSIDVVTIAATINGLANLLVEVNSSHLTADQEKKYRDIVSGDTQRILSAIDRMRALQKDDSDGN